MPATAGVQAHEEPVLWFSLNREWEQSACKMRKTPGGMQRLTKDETKALCGGLVRFGYPARLLVPWPAIAAKAGISKDMLTALEKAGQIMGADPGEWLGHLGSMPISLFIIEIEQEGKWVRVATPDASFSRQQVDQATETPIGRRNGGVVRVYWGFWAMGGLLILFVLTMLIAAWRVSVGNG